MSDYIEKFKIPDGAQTRQQICDKIAAIDVIISALYDTALVSVGNGSIVKYKIDTGQTKQDVEYTSTTEVTAAITEYENIRQLLQNKLQKRAFRLMDGKNFRG